MAKGKINMIALGLCVVLAGCSKAQLQTTSTIDNTLEASEESSASDTETDEKSFDKDYTNNESEEHAISVSGEEASYDNILVNKTGDSEGDESDFYGTNAAVYAENSGKLTITSSKIITDGAHANAVFSYGDGTVVNISDSTIETSSNNSGGIMVTGGGELNASNLQITTQGGSSAAIRSDRGGGTMNVDGGSYSSYGAGSPAIYSTANVTVKNATLYSDISQAVVVEGKNSVTLENVDATGKNTNKNSDKSDVYQAVMVYQSMSGDADEGKATFNMNGGSLTSLNGGMFFVTNTVADINLENVTLNYASDDLLRIEKAGWGNEGSNGGQVNFTASNQKLEGCINVDEISKLNLYLQDGASLEGAIISDGETYVEIKDGATWKLTGDSSIKSLTCEEGSIDLNGYTLTINGKSYEAGTKITGEAIEFTYPENSGMPGNPPDGMTPPDGQTPPDGMTPPDGQTPPDGMTPPGDFSGDRPEGTPPDMSGEKPDGNPPEKPDGNPPEKPN